MEEHRTYISFFQKIYFGSNSTLQAKEGRNIKYFAPKNWFWSKFHIKSQKMQDNQTVGFWKWILGQITHFKQKNARTSNLNQFAPKNWFWAKFHITSQEMQEHQTFISLLLKIDFGPNSTLQTRECRNLYQFDAEKSNLFQFCTWKLIWGQIPHYKIKNGGSSNLYHCASKNWF